MGNTVEQFFEDIERESKEGKTLPVWYVFFCWSCAVLLIGGRRGELYLEVYCLFIHDVIIRLIVPLVSPWHVYFAR